MRREQTTTESRERLLDAAAALFAEKGFRQTTFVDVAERSGISRGSIPWHFGSKEGLLLAVLERSIDRLRAGLPGTGSGQALEPDGLRSATAALAAFFDQPTTRLFVTLLVEALEPDSTIRSRYVELHDLLRSHCRAYLESVRLPPGVASETLAVVLVGAGIGVHQQWLLAPDRVDKETALAALHTLVIGYRGQP